MRRTDSQLLGPNGAGGSGTKSAHHSAPIPWVEQRIAPHPTSDLEEHASSWENAWIDLGGEG